jgi:hypothetical protein
MVEGWGESRHICDVNIMYVRFDVKRIHQLRERDENTFYTHIVRRSSALGIHPFLCRFLRLCPMPK